MIYLIIVSLIWALSFSLIKGSLTSIDPNFVAFIRLVISLIVFLPFLKIKKIDKKLISNLLIIGAIQYGLMYSAYIYSYQFLKAYEIAILTIFTPLFVVLISDILEKKISGANWLKALLAIVGAGVIIYSENTELGFWLGILLIQLSNFLFALGQVFYKKIITNKSLSEQKNYYGIIFLGGVLITGIFSFFTTDFNSLKIESSQILVLFYLGAVASGLAFFMWNVGATKVKTGTLAVFNNLKIPLGVFVALFILRENANLLQLILGSLIIISAFIIKENK